MPGWLKLSILVLSAILLLALFSGEVRDTDIFWHLRTGQYILETHSLPVPDPFSYMNTGEAYTGEAITRRFNLTHEWLAQVLMYLIHAASGFTGLVIIRVLVLEAFCVLTGCIAFRRTRDFALSVCAALGAAGMSFYFAQSRPFLATFAFLAITMLILESRCGLWLLPGIFVVWANCHGGFILGWLMCAAYCFEAVVWRFRKQETTYASRVWVVSAVSIMASAVNPNAFRVLQVLWLYRGSGIQTTNLEWQRPIFWMPSLYSVLLFGPLLVMLFARRRTRPVDWFLYFGFAAISLMAVRNTIFMGLIGPVLIVSYLPRWRVMERFGATAILVFGAAGLLVYDVAPAAAARNTLAFRAGMWQLPVEAANFIEKNHITARMFNNYEAGGYLIWRLWPLQRVFIDGRGLSEKAFADYRRILYDSSGGKIASSLFDQYGIELIVTDGFDYLSGQVYPVAVDLAKTETEKWKLIYADKTSVIFMRHPPPSITPLDSRTALLDSLAAQCREHLRYDPARPRCAFGLGEFYAYRGDREHAREWISQYMARGGAADREADEMYQSLTIADLNSRASDFQAAGNLPAAESLLRQALAIANRSLGPDHPDTAGALNNLAAVLEAEDKYPEAESLFRRALEICEKRFGSADPHTAMALDNLAGALESRGDLANAETLLRRALSAAEHSLKPGDPALQTIREDLDALLRARHAAEIGR